MNHIQLLAHSLAARVPAMSQDCHINNAHLIQKEVEQALHEEMLDRDVLLLNALLAIDELLKKRPLWEGAERSASELAGKMRAFMVGRISR